MVVVGLGNPGPKYAFNRHNVGFMVVDRFAEINRCKWVLQKLYAESCCGNFWLLKPLTYMNASGVAVREFLTSACLSVNNLIVVYDDVDLPCGKLRIRPKGSSGGHKGLESIIKELGTPDFIRIRIGIGPKPRDLSLADFVLQDFTKEELLIIDKVIDLAIKAIFVIANEGIQKAMTFFNSHEVVA
ncbi:aminoacyl-tRNA hydrolase [Pseudothermotoga thermarum]|uniref:Peptidyl-tRNA hydrolase n=1 Tax=Pseudothermotoga thermarum DSM 5069 TaxID=688269 RepID=F7YYA2_9THEM|nr:aminoacyl-tRNA hydrolase [Pseudothermotoga thermarum]AEH50923.1 peptidyl-tRNA hydrolase [Pseudothermotoga thermarum DSM 5069]